MSFHEEVLAEPLHGLRVLRRQRIKGENVRLGLSES